MRKSHHLGRGGKRIALLLCMTLVWMSVTPASQVTVEGATLSQLKDKQNQLQQEKEENQEKLNDLKESEE